MTEQILEIEQLSKSFAAVRAVDNVSLQIKSGEIFGLLGPNGAGKTTTISMVCGLLRPDAGTIAVGGQQLQHDLLAAKRRMGVVPQEVALYEELTGEQNLRFWGQLAGLSAQAATVRAAELLDELSLTDRRREPVRTYSGGMKRRINIGCALMHRPDLLLLDEPTVGIDPQARANILRFVRSLAAQGTAVLYTTHYLEEAESLCDRIGIIDEGRLLAVGTLAELQERLGGERLFVLDGEFQSVRPTEWKDFDASFRVIHQRDHQLVVSSKVERHPAECLRQLLNIPVQIENATLKRPNLNDVFLQLTGRELRE